MAEVPSEISGRQVASIRYRAFSPDNQDVSPELRSIMRMITRIVLPDSVQKIDVGVFADCEGLTEIHFPASMNTIAECAFYGCSKLVQMVLPDGIREIEDALFQNCYSLETVEISALVRHIHERAFSGCKNLLEVKNRQSRMDSDGLGRSLIIDNEAFKDCSKLRAVPSQERVIPICFSVFSGCIGIKEARLPVVQSLWDEGFRGSGLQRIELPKHMMTIRGHAFHDCVFLTFVEIPDSKLIVGESAFEGCSQIEKIQMPLGVKRLEKRGFTNCGALREMILPESIHQIEPDALFGDDIERIIVPVGTEERFKLMLSKCLKKCRRQ